MVRNVRAGANTQRTRHTPQHKVAWQPIEDLALLSLRAIRTGAEMGPLVDVPALVRIEDEHWIFERIEESTLTQLTHRLILHTDEGEQVFGVTKDFTTAIEVAKYMAERDQRTVLIQAL